MRLAAVGPTLAVTLALGTIAPSEACAQAADGASLLPEGAAALPEGANAMCPVMTDEPVDPAFSVEWNGRTVYLCCKRCMSKFRDDPEAYAANLPPLEVIPTADALDAQPESPVAAPEAEPQALPAEPPPFDLMPYLGRFHVLSVHFPIALLAVGALFEIVGGRRDGARAVVRACVGLGALAAVASALLGLVNDAVYVGFLADVYWWHRLLGLVAAGLAVVAYAAVEWRRVRPDSGARIAAPLAVIGCAAIVSLVGHLGGSLVFGWDYLKP